MAATIKRPSQGTKFFQQDIVQKVGAPDWLGIVLRCWHDAEDVPPEPWIDDPLMRPLQRGEFGVSFLSKGGERHILQESELLLVDRSLQAGDFCKRSIDDVRSGVVVSFSVNARVAHSISQERAEGWRTVEDIDDNLEPQIGDFIEYDDWIGQVIEVFDESLVQLGSGQIVRLPEVGSRLNVGDTGPTVLPPTPNALQSFFGFFQSCAESSKDIVVATRHSAYAIAWLALNQTLDPAIAADKKRPQRFWSGDDIGKLTLIRGRSDMEMRVGDRVRLKKVKGLPLTKHGQEADPTGVVTVDTFLVKQTETTLDVLWQDGTRESVRATEVIPYLNPDEYDVWPGDHVIWKTDGESRSAIVQSVDAAQRVAQVFCPDTGAVELASVLELDPHGTSDTSTDMLPMDTFGVRRGEFIFIHKEGTTNGAEKPRVPRIGELEAWVRGNPAEGIDSPAWRKEFHELGTSIASQRTLGRWAEKPVKRAVKEDTSLHWCGEVTGLNLDGTVAVTHPDFTVKSYPLERITRLYDGLDQIEDGLFDEEGSQVEYAFMDEGEETWAMEEDGVWRAQLQQDDWEDMSDESADEKEVMDMMGETTGSMVQDIPMEEDDGSCPSPPGTSASIPIGNDHAHGGDGEEISWKKFDVLSSAPADHAFYSTPGGQRSKSFLSRLQKEYRALSSSLPDSIVVRAYEDRTDLLRTLIIGPENTPYEDAPFVIDWLLDSNFPQSPPIAHFLSWTNGNGRVNPNLYEEGKVCLSILGTWTGDETESWSSSRSSLLQAFVSIQGLVLVKEPWFCEPAYEKLRGTEEGTVNSRLYSEKAYVLSRGFVRRALEIPPGGLEPEIKFLYFGKKRLAKVVRDAQSLIDKSRESSEVQDHETDLAVPRLTVGGIITLERTLVKLRGFLGACKAQ